MGLAGPSAPEEALLKCALVICGRKKVVPAYVPLSTRHDKGSELGIFVLLGAQVAVNYGGSGGLIGSAGWSYVVLS